MPAPTSVAAEHGFMSRPVIELMDSSTEIAKRFGEKLFITRRRSGLSQEELAFRASVHRTEIGKLERGDRLPRIDTLIKLAGALSVPPGDLLKGIAWSSGAARGGRFLLSDSTRRQS